MKKLIFTLIIILFGIEARAQLGFSYQHSLVSSSFGVSTNPDNNLWGEARFGLNSNEFEITGMILYNVVRREDFKLYTGGGIGTILDEGNFSLALGFQVKPIESKDNFTLFGEYNPLFDTEAGTYIGSGNIGFRYFLKPKK